MPTNAWAAAGALLALGALHGLNPGMGWLFAVALGTQRGERRAVWRALGPLALGHALAIASAVAVALGLGVVVPSGGIRWGAAALLIGLGVWQLRGHRHAGLGRWHVGLRATGRELTLWSFVVATAHGAGLMAAPVALRAVQSGAAGHAHHVAHDSAALATVVPGFGRALRSVAVLIKNDVGIEAAQVDLGGWDTHSAQDPIAGSMFRTMQDFSNSLAAFYADVIATGFSVTVVSVSEFGRNVRENGSLGTDHGRGTVMLAMGKGISGGRVLTKNWPGLARDHLADGQDLQVTVDYRDILAEIVQKRLANPNLDFVFPTWSPTMLGVTR